MYILFSSSLFLMILTILVMSLASLLSKKSITDQEKASPFECGFDPKSSSRIPFSLQFFLIAVIFLIFDVEIALLLPLICILQFSTMLYWYWVSSIFMLILLLGLYHEWNQGSLNWATN
uniref:NADH-ubiquinone oxidoreductase chain 3 n=1 Tax=Habrophlebiodes zijinensis TaxID=289472 RepID=A0A0B4IKD9_9INSE|nr:NADH dehydrogenase subunit 3 [Habrophlebiodes zijinensis]